MGDVRGRSDQQSCCPQPLLTKVLVNVIYAAAGQIHPSVFRRMVHGVAAEQGRLAASKWRLTHRVARQCDNHACAHCLEVIGRQCGWILRVAIKSADVLRVDVLGCQFTSQNESRPYLCELALGLFSGVVGEARGYAKACASQCSKRPPLECAFTIYLRESEANLAIPGVVYPPMNNEPALRAEESRAGAPGERLTPRETQVLGLIAQGLSDKKIAAALRLSVRTVENHNARIRQKLCIHSRTGLARYAFRTRLVEL